MRNRNDLLKNVCCERYWLKGEYQYKETIIKRLKNHYKKNNIKRDWKIGVIQ